jgi:predicted Zn-dependent protease
MRFFMRTLNQRNGFYFISLFFSFIPLLILQSCATNPVTNKMELMLVSENKEFGIGQSVDKQVREEMGIYLERPELTNLLKQMVETMGKKSHRPDLIYRVEIVDTPDFNAFAVPGGFVYAHRGLLERINSADELASIMGHEIAHVAARHSASQLTKQQLLNIGVIGATIAAGGGIQQFGDLVNIGSVLAFSKFSRDDEREADRLGIKYMVDAGYNPQGAIEAMKTIQRINDREPGSLETWFMTHPQTSERVKSLTNELNALSVNNPEILNRKIKRNEYISLLDGMAVGEYNGKELIRDDRYFNKEYLISIPIPSGWQGFINTKGYIAVFQDTKNQIYTLFNIEELRKIIPTAEYMNNIVKALQSKGLKKENTGAQQMSHGALSARFTGVSNNKQITVNLAAFVKGDRGYNFLEVTEKGDSTTPITLNNMVNGINFLTQAEAIKLEPARMKVHQVKAGETWDNIIANYYDTKEGKVKLAEYNGLTAATNPEPGILIKIPPTLRFK